MMLLIFAIIVFVQNKLSLRVYIVITDAFTFKSFDFDIFPFILHLFNKLSIDYYYQLFVNRCDLLCIHSLTKEIVPKRILYKLQHV